MSVYQYISECCSSTATKPPCIKPVVAPGEKIKTTADMGLGHWTCSTCGRKAKVSRKKNEPNL